MNSDNISRTIMANGMIRNNRGILVSLRLICEDELWYVTLDRVVIYESNDDQAANREYLAWLDGTIN
jgi:hypothetical protein